MLSNLILTAILSFSGMRYGGTFIGAVICADGIVMASDSRTTFLDANENRFAYVDGMPKIYVDRGAAIAVSGITNLEGELFSSFVRLNHDLLTRPVNEILFGFLVWLPFSNSNNVALISAGYFNGTPMICAKSPVLPQECGTTGYIASKESNALRGLIKLGRLPTTAEAAAALRAAIQERGRSDVTVGGPITLLKLTNGALPAWLENRPNDNGWSKICDLVDAHRRGAAHIIPMTSTGELERRLNAICPR
jgi:hypothetical protein